MRTTPLISIKLLHTVVWAFFAGCVVAIPIAATLNQFAVAAWLSGIVFLEVLVLLANGWRCPLTSVAARYTDERRDNFDIYLPVWVARNNKLLFGTLYVIGMMFTLVRWMLRS